MRFSIAILCFVTLVIRASAQTDDAPSPTAVPFTPEPRQSQWRIGFNMGNVTILETPELNPDNDFKAAVREAERLLPRPVLSFGLALLPFMKVNVDTRQLVNPRQWTILDLEGKSTAKSFQGIGIFMGTQMTSTEGGYHLVSMASMPSDPFLGVRKEPFSGNLIFGIAGNVKTKHLRTKLFETKWENLLPVEDPATLPAGYEAAKELLDDKNSSPQQRFIYGTSIEALVRGRVAKLWLLNYSHPDTTIGTHPWGIFLEQSGRLEPLYINKPSVSDEQYVAYFVASLDLDGDSTDELVLEASYRLGTAFKVISASGGNYRETYTSYYRGPA
ncbi:MAG: hypothetical protein DMG15_09565 [Acidobacteria bacterium]|nr:MAG: hypothetical protein DMG15_09565 [Acidobacteriota bacterium]